MGGQVHMRRSPGVRPVAHPGSRDRARGAEAARPGERILELQRRAGNQAVLQLLGRNTGGVDPTRRLDLQRDVNSSRENPPIGSTHPSGTLSEAEWAVAYQAAKAKPTVEAYRALFHDIAVTVGMTALGADFVPGTVPVSDGKTAKPGLNMTLSTSGEPGTTGWVDRNGAFGVPMTFEKGVPSVSSFAIVLSPLALSPDKTLSLSTARHEMVHGRHKTKVLAALQAWQSAPGRGRPDFDTWLKRQGAKKKNPMSALDVALIGKGVKDAAADTEVLAYVEGFTTQFHRLPATVAQAGPAFFELLGVAETHKLYTWAQASPVVQVEALSRLRDYHAALDADHQRVWKEWLDKQVTTAAKDTTGRKDFLTRLAAIVT